MSAEDETVLLIKGTIASLPAVAAEQCNELADHIRRAVKLAGEPVGSLALALVGAEAQRDTK